ncbi:hypothetical protein ACFWNN_11485 [Lentzea sp. NPDC058450]|uniref:hypothetical protein n=1 Tax=Lentzea sp. NPDC058450 TaxID=3346505 RepID=UPI00365E3393
MVGVVDHDDRDDGRQAEKVRPGAHPKNAAGAVTVGHCCSPCRGPAADVLNVDDVDADIDDIDDEVDEVDSVNVGVDGIDGVNTDVDELDDVNTDVDGLDGVEVDDIVNVHLIPARPRAGCPPGVAALTSATPASWSSA